MQLGFVSAILPDLTLEEVLAFASDFHAGPTTYPRVFAILLEELLNRKPDVLLLGGGCC